MDLSVQQPSLTRRGSRLVVMDVDSTLIQDEVIELIAAHADCQDAVADVTTRAMAGEIDFAESLRNASRCSRESRLRHSTRCASGFA